MAAAPVLVSSSSIKDHPHNDHIVALAKQLYATDSPHTCKTCSGQDYITQALKMAEAMPKYLRMSLPDQHSKMVSFTNATGSSKAFYLSLQCIMDDFRDVLSSAPHLPQPPHGHPMLILLAPSMAPLRIGPW